MGTQTKNSGFHSITYLCSVHIRLKLQATDEIRFYNRRIIRNSGTLIFCSNLHLSEDGVVGGIQFNIKGDNFNKTVTTDKDGNITVEGLFPATYTITEQSIDRYEPQKSQTVNALRRKRKNTAFSTAFWQTVRTKTRKPRSM